MAEENFSGAESTQNGSNAADNSSAASNSSDAQNVQNAAQNASETDIQRLIQSAVDRATQKLGTDNKGLRERIAELERKGMSDEEKHKADMDERERDITRREAELKLEKNKMYALTAIKNANLDDGGNTALELIDLVMAEDEKGIDARVKSLSGLVTKMVAAEVDKAFKASGRSPENDTGAGGEQKDDKTEYARSLGKKAAAENKRSREILDMYTKK